jgi:hypothetical protein
MVKEEKSLADDAHRQKRREASSWPSIYVRKQRDSRASNRKVEKTNKREQGERGYIIIIKHCV